MKFSSQQVTKSAKGIVAAWSRVLFGLCFLGRSDTDSQRIVRFVFLFVEVRHCASKCWSNCAQAKMSGRATATALQRVNDLNVAMILTAFAHAATGADKFLAHFASVAVM